MNLDWLMNWSFKNKNERNTHPAHKIHRYPATFIPELANKLITTFSNPNDTVLDIFAGSGTTLLEARLLQRNAIGLEMNPLAILISQVKNKHLPIEILQDVYTQWEECFLQTHINLLPLNINNVDFWFHPKTIESIQAALMATNSVAELNHDKYHNVDNVIKAIKAFFQIAISEVLREISYCVHSGFKLHRDKVKLEQSLSFDKPAFLNIFGKVFWRNAYAIDSLGELNNTGFTLHQCDSRVLQTSIDKESVDFILTSPPYGDSRTTVAYGKFSSFSSELFGLPHINSETPVRQLDNDLLGGRTKHTDVDALRNNLSMTLSNVQELFLSRAMLLENKSEDAEAKKTITRLKDILSFYDDLDLCLANASHYLKPNKYLVLVTGSRVIGGVKLHTDYIIAEMVSRYGFVLKNIYYRDIVNKRMPSKVSASNIKGQVAPTMTQESIVVLQKLT